MFWSILKCSFQTPPTCDVRCATASNDRIIIPPRPPAAKFDFSRDFAVIGPISHKLFLPTRQTPDAPNTERGQQRRPERDRLLARALSWFDRVLELDPENVTAHYNLGLIHAQLGHKDRAARHRALHATFKPDDNARDRAVAAARMKDPAANHAAEAVVIYDLQRPGTYGLPPQRLTAARPY